MSAVFTETLAAESANAWTTSVPCGDAETPQNIELADAVSRSLQSQPQLIIAEQNALESRSDLHAATAPFLPSAQLVLTEERYVPSNGAGPVVVVGNTVLGGAQTKSAYGSISLSWNLMSSGRDIAAYRGAQAGVRAASSGVDSQLGDTLSGVLEAYADLYEAEVSVRSQASGLAGLKAIQARAEERYENGHGTTVAIGQARAAALDAEQSLNRACRTVSDKSARLTQAVGIRIPSRQRLAVEAALPVPVDSSEGGTLDDSVESTPAVVVAKEKVAQAQAKLQQAQRAFGPSVSLSVRRDYLGQDPDSFGRANGSIAPNDYRVGLSFEQPLFPLVSEVSAVGKARAELRKAQASYEQARLEAETKVRGAWSAQREAEATYRAAKSSLAEAQRVLILTDSLYRAGRIDLDSVQHAQIDTDKAAADVETLASRRALSGWMAARALQPTQFPDLIFRQLHLQLAQRWRDGAPTAEPSEANLP